MDYLILSNSDSSSMARICLCEGGRIIDFVVNNTEIITVDTSTNYKEDFASAILFPFANRIKNGEYDFDSNKYKLVCNEKTGENAIHGLVYDKYFEVVRTEAKRYSASVTLSYNEGDGCDGFPFKYSIILKYTLNKDGLSVKVAVKNTDEKPFPFTIGWHPYFLSSDLQKSTLFFQSNENVKEDMTLQFNNKKYDEAYALKSSLVKFNTPTYQLQLKSSASTNFLQIYTPEYSKTIAIEPMTGVSDSFNNNIGKQILNPNEDFLIEWTLNISTN